MWPTLGKSPIEMWLYMLLMGRQPIAVSDISIYICLIDIRSKSKEQLNERRAGLSNGHVFVEKRSWTWAVNKKDQRFANSP